MNPPHPRFSPLQRLLHWLMAICVIAMLFIGVGMVSTLMPKYLPLITIHKTLGIAILILALLRLALRLRVGAPSLPADLPAPMKLAAHLSHYALYGLMIAMPLLGWAMLSAAEYPVVLYGRKFLRRSCRKATVCIRCSGTRIIIWPSPSLRWCCCTWPQRCSTRWCGETAYSKRLRHCRSATRPRRLTSERARSGNVRQCRSQLAPRAGLRICH